MLSFIDLYIDRPRVQPGSLKAYLIAAALAAVAIMLSASIASLFSNLPFLVAFAAVVITAFTCGTAAAFLAMAMAMAVAGAWGAVFLLNADYDLSYRTGVFLVGSVTVVLVIGAMHKATAHVRRLNDTLKISEQKFRNLLESAPDAMVIVDDHHNVTLINARTESVFGYDRGELLGEPASMLIREADRRAYTVELAALAAEALSGPMTRVIELNGVRKSGAEFPIELSLCALNVEPGLLISTAIRDVTLRRQIEASLIEANRAKSNFLASMSHELRTPLNAILGFSHLLQSERNSTLTTKQQEYVGHVLEGGNHLSALVGQLLDLAAIETNRLDLAIDTLAPRDIVSKAYGLMSPMAENNGVAFAWSVADDIDDVVADELRLRQVLLNLLSNAMKYNRPGGTVSLTAISANGRVRFAVADTGIGISSDLHKEVFQPFQRLGAEQTKIEGMGIGLALSRKLIEAMNGTMGFESEPGQGSIFWIELPGQRRADMGASARQVAAAR